MSDVYDFDRGVNTQEIVTSWLKRKIVSPEEALIDWGNYIEEYLRDKGK